MLLTLFSPLWWYGCVALAWITGWALSVATTPCLTDRLFTPAARLLGLRPRSVVILATLGGSLLWPLATLLLVADLAPHGEILDRIPQRFV